MDLMVQFYRGDVYGTHGLSPATTWDAYAQNLAATNNAGVRFATACQASISISIVYEYLNHLSSFGGELWNYDGTNLTTALGTTEAADALQNYVNLVQYADPGSGSFTWDDVNRDLYLGIAGSAVQLESLEYYMEDPSRSKVLGEMRYAPNPAGPKGSFSTFAGSGIGVSKYSRNPEASWLWLQWAVSKGRQEAAVLGRYRAYPSRKSVFGSSDVGPQLGGEAYQGLSVARGAWGSGAPTSLTPFPQWFSALQQISYYLNQAFSGTPPSTALNMAVQKIDQLGSLTF